MPLSGAKDEHFSCFHSSCQWGLKGSGQQFQKQFFFISTQNHKRGYQKFADGKKIMKMQIVLLGSNTTISKKSELVNISPWDLSTIFHNII